MSGIDRNSPKWIAFAAAALNHYLGTTKSPRDRRRAVIEEADSMFIASIAAATPPETPVPDRPDPEAGRLPPETIRPPKRRGRPKGSKNKSKGRGASK